VNTGLIQRGLLGQTIHSGVLLFTWQCAPHQRLASQGTFKSKEVIPPHLIEDGEALPNLAAVAKASSASDVLIAEPDVRFAPNATGSPVWLAAYTSPRHEKLVARHLQVRDVEHYLPLWKTTRRWKNGCTVPVEFPVFPSYIFISTHQRDSSCLLNIPGLLAFVGCGRQATPIPQSEIDWLRNELPLRRYKPYPYLSVGDKVRIRSGPLTGCSGILVRWKNDLRVVLSIDLIQQSVAVEVGSDEIEQF